MAALALVLLVRGAGAGYGEAGLVAAAYGIAVAVGAPYGGRQVDRRGARLVLCGAGWSLFPSLFGLVAVLGAVEAPIAAIAVAAAAARADDAAGLVGAPLDLADGRRRGRREDGIRPRRGAAGGDLRRRAAARRRPRDDRPRWRRSSGGGPRRRGDVRVLADPAGARGRARRGEAQLPKLGALSAIGVRTIALLCVCASGSASARVEIAVPAFAETCRATARSPGSRWPASRPDRSSAGSSRACGRRRDERRRIIVGTFAARRR